MFGPSGVGIGVGDGQSFVIVSIVE